MMFVVAKYYHFQPSEIDELDIVELQKWIGGIMWLDKIK